LTVVIGKTETIVVNFGNKKALILSVVRMWNFFNVKTGDI
jgi:hypothetical protein